jgi:NAD(P)H dehydrogenase (quinone)
MPNAPTPALLVTGASGRLGRHVVELLLDAGAGPLIATTRSPDKLADLAARGVDVRKADFDQPATLEPAFAGANRMLLISTDTIDTPGRRIEQHRAAIDAAEKAGVQHAVYTSALAPLPAPHGAIGNDHFWTEHALVASNLSWTILRHNIYSDMLFLSVPQAVATGQLFSAAEGGARGYVTREDCARTDAAALAASSTECTLYDVTGPAAVTQDELAALVSEVTGRPVAHVRLPPEALRQGLTQAGLPPFVVDATLEFDIAARRGYQGVVTPVVKELTGQEPVSLRDFLLDNRAALGAPAP